jgi:Kef-type K+ transport system membrane component KefB
LQQVGLIGALYVCARVGGKYVSASIGARFGGASRTTRRWIGLALLPQAGAAIGMALVASNQFPEFRQQLLSIVISTTILFEFIGPVLTRVALNKASRPNP